MAVVSLILGDQISNNNNLKKRAKVAGVSLILGDQAIEDVSARTQVLFKETIRDLATPLQGGWTRCVEDLRTGLKLGKDLL